MKFKMLVAAAFWFAFTRAAAAGEPSELPALPLLAHDRILILAPHPDDDILGCAGVIQSALEKRLPLQVVYLTNGDNYEWAFMAYKKRPVLNPAEMRQMGSIRHQEAVAGENILGIPSAQLLFLGYPDWGTENIFLEHWGQNRPAFRSMLTKVTAVPYADGFHPGAPYKGESVLADLEKIMLEFKPTKVFVAHPADAHRDHRTFYLFAQVALWDLEDSIRPLLYPYLIHYPHWPAPRGFVTGRRLQPPPYFHDLQWTELDLSGDEIKKKRQALELHRTQMAKDRRYLESFVASNELFAGFPVLHLAGPASASSADLPAVKEHPPISSEEPAMTQLQWRYIYREGDQLNFRMEFSSHSHLNRPVTTYAFGYRRDRPFADMPKLKLVIQGRKLSVFDQGRRILDPSIQMDRLKETLVVHVPLAALGNPERLIGTAWSRAAEEPFDWRVWRAVDLRPEGGPR